MKLLKWSVTFLTLVFVTSVSWASDHPAPVPVRTDVVPREFLVVLHPGEEPILESFMMDIRRTWPDIEPYDLMDAADCVKVIGHVWTGDDLPSDDDIITLYHNYGLEVSRCYRYQAAGDPGRRFQEPYPLGAVSDDEDDGFTRVIQSWKRISVPPYPATIVQILDTGGFYYEHPDLLSSIWVNEEEDLNSNGTLDEGDLNGIDDDGTGYVDDVIGYDFTECVWYDWQGNCMEEKEMDNDPSPDLMESFFSHGTAVASVLGCVTNNEYGLSGVVYPGCVKVQIAKAGRAGWVTSRAAVRAIHYAMRTGVRVINMSWGKQQQWQTEDDDALHAAIDCFMEQYDGIVVAAAGNFNDDQPVIPAAWPGVVSVAGSDAGNNRAWFSSWGNWVDIAAPAVYVPLIWFNPMQMDWQWTEGCGTSFSSPIVAGITANLCSQNPFASNERIVQRVFDSVYKPADYPPDDIDPDETEGEPWFLEDNIGCPDPPDPPGPHVYYGRGIINAVEVMRPLYIDDNGILPHRTNNLPR